MSKGSNWRKGTDYKKYWDSDFWKKDKTTSDKSLRMTCIKTVIVKPENKQVEYAFSSIVK
jgi:hypothetical protein